MEKAKLENIKLDEEDAKLLKLKSDLLLKAKGIRYSILPKLNVILEEALSCVRKVYGIEVFNEDSIISSSPAFREKRDSELKINYDYAMIGIGGARKSIWKEFPKIDGKDVKIINYKLVFVFTEYGISIRFISKDVLKLTDESFRKYFDFLKSKLSLVQTIQFLAGMNPFFYCNDIEKNALVPFDELLNEIVKSKIYILDFSRNLRFPIGIGELNEIINSFVIFYPIYVSLLRIAKEETPIFEELISKVKYKDIIGMNEQEQINENKITNQEADDILSKNVDDTKFVKAGIRWQVFERDDFKCVACGKSASDGAILHVDHIIPRSKGGKDEIDNYQTLCHLCNIGKSNKNNKDLRKNSCKWVLLRITYALCCVPSHGSLRHILGHCKSRTFALLFYGHRGAYTESDREAGKMLCLYAEFLEGTRPSVCRRMRCISTQIHSRQTLCFPFTVFSARAISLERLRGATEANPDYLAAIPETVRNRWAFGLRVPAAQAPLRAVPVAVRSCRRLSAPFR
jgi:hypothetical protein